MKLKSILLFGSAVAIAGTSLAQSKVTTGGQKHPLLEEATGTWCMWCPDGAQVIQEKVLPYGTSTNYPRAIVASFHNGGSDKMTLPNDPYNEDLASGGTGYISGWPGGTVDRTPYTPAHPTDIDIYRRYWPAAVGVRNSMTPKFDVSMECLFDSVTRVISIKVKAKALSAVTGNYRINAYIVEDSIPSNATGFRQQSSSAINAGTYVSESGSPTWYAGFGTTIADSTKYSHMDVVRKILSTSPSNGINNGIWGDTAFSGAAAGDSLVKTYSYTIPASINGSNCYPKYTKVIGLVQKYGATNTDREIDNAIEAKVRLMWKTLPTTGFTTLRPMQEIELYPNPAKNQIVVNGVLENQSEVSLTITNAVGQRVFSEDYKAGSSLFGAIIPIDHLSNGVYFVNIATNGGNVTKQFTVSK